MTCQDCADWYQVTQDKRRKGECQLVPGNYCGPRRTACSAFKPINRPDAEAREIKGFIGGEFIGVIESDFEVYYPEEEG